MGSCSSQAANAAQTVITAGFELIQKIVELEKTDLGDLEKTNLKYKELLSLLYNINKYNKDEQTLIFRVVENSLK